MEIAIRDRRTYPRRWRTLLVMVSAAALLTAGLQLLAPAPAGAMTEEEGAGDPECQMTFWWFLEACEEEEEGGGGGSSGGGSSSDNSDDSYDGDDVCAEFGHCDSAGDQGSDGGSPSGDPHDDICGRYGSCDDDSAKGGGWEPKEGWDASDEEETDAAEQALGKADQDALERDMVRRAKGAKQRPCDERFWDFVNATDPDEEGAARQRFSECLREHRSDPQITARGDRVKKGHRKRTARRPGKREPDTAARRG